MPGQSPRFDELQLRRAIARSFNWKETLRNLGYCPTGSNPQTVKKYVARWKIDVSHFDPDLARHRGLGAQAVPLADVMVRDSTYNRGSLKFRLYSDGLKERRCEICGQGEAWLGSKIALILDHINGVRDDNRIENLRIVCPNCAATLPTHCGRGLRKPKVVLDCERCGKPFPRKTKVQRFCSRDCGQLASSTKQRQTKRPPREQLMSELEASNYCAVARKYGVTDNAIRKWVRAYERDAAAGDDAGS